MFCTSGRPCYLNTLMEIPKEVSDKVAILPDSPGVYQFYDATGKIIYIGKAKSLKKRVSSYFNRDNYENRKTAVLVKNVRDVKVIVVNTEIEALLLENNLIKQHQPRYNVNLKDDKTYPWICIKKERFPRVFPTRNFIRDGSEYFGPYGSVKVMNTVLELIRSLYKLRNCNLQLTQQNIDNHKFRVCLEYHIGNCKGPCEGHQDEEDYNQTIDEIRDIIKGNASSVIRRFQKMIQEASTNYEFEKAQLYKEKMDILERFQSKTVVVSPSINNVDVYTIQSDEQHAYVNYLTVVNGSIVQGNTVEYKKKLDESDEEILVLAIAEMRMRFSSPAKEALVPFPIEVEIPGLTFSVPQRGDKKHLLELSEKNVEYYRKERLKQEELVDPERHTKRIMKQMMKDLRMQEEPRHIECFDNSNIQGAYPVAAMTVFKDGKPSKKDYRHFNIKTVEGPNDFASMEEIIFRRYRRVLEEGTDMPQLIVIDGGKGQLSAALKSLEDLGLRGKVTVIGIAKKLEEIYYPDDPLPMYLDKKSETLKIIQQIRNEAHRFGITHHRKRREKGTIKSELTNIKGISDTTAQKLLLEFKSVTKVKEATEEQIAAVIGKSKAALVKAYFAAKQQG